ncbi:PREDICTED: transcription factor kayak-like [Priapulus caudatus]|uniref:Transcription factor kayak-like n=1 Tax=Priapulus caudatus TaxID=37621 RepID=A0ABM1EDY2_PRICU|nr:PREDICTED: transcription factor kayak-like [Priapulus caudatus]
MMMQNVAAELDWHSQHLYEHAADPIGASYFSAYVSPEAYVHPLGHIQHTSMQQTATPSPVPLCGQATCDRGSGATDPPTESRSVYDDTLLSGYYRESSEFSSEAPYSAHAPNVDKAPYCNYGVDTSDGGGNLSPHSQRTLASPLSYNASAGESAWNYGARSHPIAVPSPAAISPGSYGSANSNGSWSSVDEELSAAEPRSIAAEQIDPQEVKTFISTMAKQTLAEQIRNRCGNIVVEYRKSSGEHLTPADELRRQRRREKNKMAAEKCRKRKRDEQSALEEREKLLGEENDKLQEEVRKLERMKNELSLMLHSHLRECRLPRSCSNIATG